MCRQIVIEPVRLRMGVLAGLLFWIATLAALLAGCGGGGNSLPALPPFVPGSVSDADRDAAYADVEALFHSVSGQPDAAAQIVAHMKTMSQFAYAEVGESGDAIGWFKDGHMYAVFTSDKLPSGPSRQAPLPPKSRDLPAGTAAYIIDAFEPTRQDASSTIGPELTDKGYNVTYLSGSVNDYKSISNAGVLVVHAHGLIATDNARVPRFWYATSEVSPPQRDSTYSQYWANGTIATGSGDQLQADGTTKTVHTYIVSDQFLHDVGITFTQNAFWMSQSCSSYNPVILNSIFDPTRGFHGVAIYGGWTLPEDTNQSTPTTLFIFDRLLGLNTVEPVDPDSPPPLDIATVQSKLDDTFRPGGALPYGESDTSDGQALFKFKTASGSNVPTIIPSVASAELDVSAQSLKISGHFGSPQGNVTLNGDQLNVQSWAETEIDVDQPTATSGTLVVRSLGGSSPNGYLLSNPFQYAALAVQITTNSQALDLGATETLNVSALAGTIPPGATYKWIVTGLGKVNGASQVTTSTPSVSYTAPDQDSAEVINLKVLSATNQVIAETGIQIVVGTQPSVQFTVSGTWNDGFTHNGTYSFTPGLSGFGPYQGLDYLFFNYDPWHPADGSTAPAIVFTLGMNLGQPVTQGETFTIPPNGQLTGPGQFRLLLDSNLNDPANGGEYIVQATGTLRITSVTNQSGSHTAHFTFTLTSIDGQGTISGSGVNIWRG